MPSRLKSLMALALLSVLFGCAKEDSNLVNPLPKSQYVYVRFVNFSGDGVKRTLNLENVRRISDIASGSISEANHPPADSTVLTVENGGAMEYALPGIIKFAPDLTYSFVALPSPNGASKYKPVDTILKLTSSSTIPTNSRDSYLKFLNANPDTTVTYSIILGCPNGLPLFSGVQYKNSTLLAPVRTGSLAVSLVRIKAGVSTPVGLYELNLAPRAQNVLIVRPPVAGREDFLVMDDLNKTVSAMAPVSEVADRTANVRVVNFSDNAVSVSKYPDEKIAVNLQPLKIDRYIPITACGSQYKDTLLFNTGAGMLKKPLSLEVLANYTVLVFDSANVKANQQIVIEPMRPDSLKGRCLIQVVHAAWSYPNGLTVSLGARSDNSARGYSSGEVLATNLQYGSVSNYIYIQPGEAPFTLFTGTEPARLRYCSNSKLEANKKYLLVISSTPAGEERLSLIEENESDKTLQYSPPGELVSIVHAVAGADLMEVTLPPFLNKSKLYYAGSIATVVPQGSQKVTLNVNGSSKDYSFEADIAKRMLMVAGGDKSKPETFIFNEEPVKIDPGTFKRRFINVAPEIPLVDIKIKESDPWIVGSVGYGIAGTYDKGDRESKTTFYFIDNRNSKTILRANDIFLTFGKAYALIFAGSLKYSNYSVIIQQEF